MGDSPLSSVHFSNVLQWSRITFTSRGKCEKKLSLWLLSKEQFEGGTGTEGEAVSELR